MLEALDVDSGGATYLSYAQHLLRTLKTTLNLLNLNFGRKEYYTPDGLGRITIRTRRGPGPKALPFCPDPSIDSWFDAIRIEYSTGTTQGFLLYHDGISRTTVIGLRERRSFRAYFVDGTVEQIAYEPPIGTENEELVPVVSVPTFSTRSVATLRTKGYRVPNELKDVYIDGSLQPRLLGYHTGSRYSGLMRGVVGSYHARGVDAPFSYSWGKTHGLVKMPGKSATPDTPQYWIVEVRQEGVYAAPVTNNGTFGGTWSVTKYMPTEDMIANQPGLRQFKTTLDLAWAAASLPDSGVVSVASGMAVPYAGTSFYDGHGWAFNYSGTEAQGISYVWSDDPAQHYSCSRFKLTFSLGGTAPDGSGILACSLSTVEASLPATFYNSQVLWVPVVDQVWSYVPQVDAAHQTASLAAYPAQDAPIHVYYAGDTEVVTRFQYTTYAAPTDEYSPNNPAVSAWETGTMYGYWNYYSEFREAISAYDGAPPTLSLYDHKLWTDTYRHQYGIGVTAGFVSTGFNTKLDSRSHTLADASIAAVSEVINGTDATQPTPIWDYHEDETVTTYMQTRVTTTGSWVKHGSVVLFMGEREAIMGLVDNTPNDSLVTQTASDDVSTLYARTTQEGGRNPDHNVSYNTANTAPDIWTVSYGAGVNSSDTSYTATATLQVGEFVHTADAVSNTYLNAFIITGLLIGDNSVISAVMAMHGNLYAADATLTPADQKANRVTWMSAGVPVVTGGFTVPTSTNPLDAVAFIGKA